VLQSTKINRHKLILLGYGGSGSNFLHWVYEMAEWTGKTDIFKTITVIDNDILDVTNLFRIPYIPEQREFSNIEKIYTIPLRFRKLSPRFMEMHEKIIDMEQFKRTFSMDTHVVYTAADLQTRQAMNETEIPYSPFLKYSSAKRN